MTEIKAEDIAAINSFPKLVSLLRDKMEWPIPDDYTFDDVVYEYNPKDLGFKPEETAKIREIHQLRPLVTGQPWGIFFVSFEDKKISVTVLRRMLRALVVKNRAAAQTPDQQTWRLKDLIFVANFGGSGEREIAFAHFSDNEGTGDLPVMKVLGWNAKDTKLHNKYVGEVLRQRLIWPEDPKNVTSWRQTWREAFELRQGEAIQTSKDLAIKLAELAIEIRARANQLLEIESENGPMRQMHEAFRKNLIQDLDADGFADMFAQTISYGMLAARISKISGDPSEESDGMHAKLVADNLADMVPRTNPFLKELFGSFLSLGGRDKRKGMDFDELGINDVVNMLNDAPMLAVLRDFGDKNPKEDPVIHFYELFLKEYDPEKRVQRGVFYTPRPVVNFIVRGVDEVLRTEFDLPLGLADTSTWGDLAGRNDKIIIPEHIDPETPFVQILDPATGTGTFIVETIDLIYNRMVEHWAEQNLSNVEITDAWNNYVPNHLLPRLTAFELMMAPYAIAHMKVGLKLSETGYTFGSNERVRVFLTNALEKPKPRHEELSIMFDALAHEAREANLAKLEGGYTVVIGNPPYSNYSANLSQEARKIVDPYRFFNNQKIVERNQLQFERNIQDDYVKFISIAQQSLQKTTIGVLGFITNATMLSSRSLRGMRESLIKTFVGIREINLHGGVNEKTSITETDENVFQISQSVAIHIYTKVLAKPCVEIEYFSLRGTKESKLDKLLAKNTSSIEYMKVTPDSEICAFALSDQPSLELSLRFDNAFESFGAGVKTNNDSILIAFDDATLTDNLNRSEIAIEYQHIRDIMYRPFDMRKIYYRKGLVKSMSHPTMKNLLSGFNPSFLASSTWTTPHRFSVEYCGTMAEMKSGTHDRGTTLFPLYRYEEMLGDEKSRVLNFKPSFRKKWLEVTGLEITIEENVTDAKVKALEVYDWIYALTFSPSYRKKYTSSLSKGFPLILFPKTNSVFTYLAKLGNKLRGFHNVNSDVFLQGAMNDIRLAGIGEARVEKSFPKYKNGKIYINNSRWFEEVDLDTWEFYYGGYQVCHKWLKDRSAKGGANPRPGRILTDDDVLHYRRTVTALTETRRIMAEIDRVIDRHGGWPDAFALGEQNEND